MYVNACHSGQSDYCRLHWRLWEWGREAEPRFCGEWQNKGMDPCQFSSVQSPDWLIHQENTEDNSAEISHTKDWKRISAEGIRFKMSYIRSHANCLLTDDLSNDPVNHVEVVSCHRWQGFNHRQFVVWTVGLDVSFLLTVAADHRWSLLVSAILYQYYTTQG